MSKFALQLIEENIERNQRGEDARSLDLGNCGMTKVPEKIGDLIWLEELILSDGWWEYDLEKMQWEGKPSQNKGEANKIEYLPPTLPFLILLKKIIFSNADFPIFSGPIKDNFILPSNKLIKDSEFSVRYFLSFEFSSS